MDDEVKHRIEDDVRSNWTGNRTRDLAGYFLTPYQEYADEIWKREAYYRSERARNNNK